MKNINWKVRLKKKGFWVALIPAIFLLVQQVLAIFGYEIEIKGLQESALQVVGTVFVLLAILGIVDDPTTKGARDSKRALKYNKPKDDEDYLH